MIEKVSVFDPLAVPPGRAVQVEWVFEHSADENRLSVPLMVIVGELAGPTALIVAGIHGDEYEGPAALFRIMQKVKPSMISGRLMIVPVANRAAWRTGTRATSLDGINLARVFPGSPNGSYTYRLAHYLFDKLLIRADFLVDCHSGGVNTIFMPVAGFYQPSHDIDESPARKSIKMAKATGLARIWLLPARAGVLSCEAIKRGIPAMGCEVGGAGGCLPDDVQRYEVAIENVLKLHRMLPGEPPARSDHLSYLSGDWQLATTSGYVQTHVDLGQAINKGELVAMILNEFGHPLETIRAQHDGIVMGVRHLRSVQAGDWATCVVEEKALP